MFFQEFLYIWSMYFWIDFVSLSAAIFHRESK